MRCSGAGGEGREQHGLNSSSVIEDEGNIEVHAPGLPVVAIIGDGQPVSYTHLTLPTIYSV